MSYKRKGLLTTCKEWARHLRPYWKKEFWGRERAAVKEEIKELSEDIGRTIVDYGPEQLCELCHRPAHYCYCYQGDDID